jgi:hypothetical protein
VTGHVCVGHIATRDGHRPSEDHTGTSRLFTAVLDGLC